MVISVKEIYDFKEQKRFGGFFSLQWTKHGIPPASSMVWSADRLLLKDFHKSSLQTAPEGESRVYILKSKMDVLTLSSNCHTKFLPSKEFWMWVKVFNELQEPSERKNLMFSEYKKTCYSSWLMFAYLAVLFLPQGYMSVCDWLKSLTSLQQTISSWSAQIFVLLMLKYIVREYLAPDFTVRLSKIFRIDLQMSKFFILSLV